MTSALPFCLREGLSSLLLCVCSALLPASVHIHLALLHGVAEERVQQQVLQFAIPVKRLFDFTQKDAVGRGNGDKLGYLYCTVAERESPLSRLI